eukprot:CAMPEP_0202728554 /NCGR_PEP_ID=MMETSP1385-20130828/185685_1 /ASSEMBLY_ACC=CAM_ASM_000861 /TAXON_ID=933848 /ORGANISM="Elphidium margaritaceum" /LENGTH=430 /DNA_ID=CAMNT_0049394805 /DNA_START=62 /DNA_END=1354 /DNA_ORIENTATION=-
MTQSLHQLSEENRVHKDLIKELYNVALQETAIQSEIKQLRKDLLKHKEHETWTENALFSLQQSGEMIGELIKPLSAEKFIVKASNGARYIVGCRTCIDRGLLKPGRRITLDFTTLTIMRCLSNQTDAMVYRMLDEAPGDVTWSSIGGLDSEIREIREAIELPLTNPELFARVGIKPPKGVLLYGPPGTGKTLLARAMANEMDCNFMKIVASSIVDKYIGESARLIREMFAYAKEHSPCIIFIDEIDAIGGRRFRMFAYAKEHSPCIIFIDEIDAIGGRRFSQGTSADREVQRTLMELMNQIDGFEDLGQVKVMMATNRPDILDPALLRPGRLDRKIKIPLPNSTARLTILKIHASKLTKAPDIEYNSVVTLSDGFNGADLRNVCTEAGMHAIREYRSFVSQEDFMKAVRKVKDGKKLEAICGTFEYNKKY